MFIISRGLGILWPIAVVIGGFGGMILSGELEVGETSDADWAVCMGAWGAFAGAVLVTAIFGRRARYADFDDHTKRMVEKRIFPHTLFFLPLFVWSILLALLVVLPTTSHYLMVKDTAPADRVSSSSDEIDKEFELELEPKPIPEPEPEPVPSVEPVVAAVVPAVVEPTPKPELPLSPPAAATPVPETEPTPPPEPQFELPSPARDWIDAKGRKLEAKLIGPDPKKPDAILLLKTADDKEYSVPLQALSVESRALARRYLDSTSTASE